MPWAWPLVPRSAVGVLALLAGCLGHGGAPSGARPPPAAAVLLDAGADFSESLALGTPEAAGIDPKKLVALTEWFARDRTPIFSLLISRDGKLVYELYTSGYGREDAHYLMSVTKSVVSALVGVAIDRGLLRGPEASVADSLPPAIFPTEDDRRRFRTVTVKEVLGMSALDAQVPPHSFTPEARARQAAFLAAPNRVSFALSQPLLPAPGGSFQYTDLTPMIAVGMVEHATGKTALELAAESLFEPMGFRNYEWMHQDPAGDDNGGYGLRLRPIDMQKLGVLYLRRGDWNGRRLLSASWVDTSFSPWIKSRPGAPAPDYGWYWWTYDYGPGWTARVANGWKGQRIAVVPEQGLVVTMTGCVEEQEWQLFDAVMRKAILPMVAARGAPAPAADPADVARLRELLEEVRRQPPRGPPGMEKRMVPSASPKERHRPLLPLAGR